MINRRMTLWNQTSTLMNIAQGNEQTQKNDVMPFDGHHVVTGLIHIVNRTRVNDSAPIRPLFCGGAISTAMRQWA